MAYSTYTDVTNEFKKINIVDGAITQAKIEEWIKQADAYINGRVGLIYATPITGTESLLVVKWISIGLVAQRIARVLEVKSITAKGDQAIPKDLIEEAKETLKMIVDKDMTLPDAELKSTDGGVSSYTSSNDVERAFKQEKEQW